MAVISKINKTVSIATPILFGSAGAYGAQMLILIGFCKGKVTPFEVISLLWYQQILLVFTLISITIPYYKRFLAKPSVNPYTPLENV
ncbi:MAG: hypothetical protein ACRDDG_07000 [Cetobacterium sp.]